ncbi:permease (plasmid) [Gemmatirosa kalamazoonensis]|uniref:Permease n=1 Tax=Gemmatirosa kalamazoonensis TaxID=861299 RepID=W0RSW0_9BACT|nr:ABC transporter permease [Gemmatirosa kalamazoonensis]AHG93761.1 permease [Gemmatirosa kalamazoonensis]
MTDLRLALRSLAKRPLFTATALVALALGIGAGAAVLGVVNAVLLRPLAYADPSRLVVVLHGGSRPVAPANFLDWRRDTRSFARMGAAEMWGPTLTGGTAAEKVAALRVTGDVFPLLGVAPLLGRAVRAGDDEPGADHVVVLSYALWQRRFGGARSALGATVRLDGEPYTVVGVMPPTFRFAPFWATRSELWAPLALGARAESRGGQSLRVFARLAPGATLDAARADVASVAARLEREFPGTNRDVAVVPLTEKVVGDVRPMLLVLSGAVTLVLLIAGANVAHMLLARGSARAREMAVRGALGATRTALVRQLLAESVVLAAAGGALGLALGAAGVRALVALAPAGLPRVDTVHLDWRVAVATIVVALLTGVACGVVPALRGAADGVSGTLRDGARGTTAGRRQHRGRRALIASEFALSCVLLVGAGLMIRTVAAMQAVDPGLDPRGVLTAIVSVTGSAEATPGRRAAFYEGLVARLAALPGVRAAGAINHVPLAGDEWGMHVTAEGRPVAPGVEAPTATFRVILPGYLRAMGIRVREGRDVAATDRVGATEVVVVNEALARRLWPGESALGKRLTLDGPEDHPPTRTVVGVVRDVVRGEWTEGPQPEAYVPFLQSESYLERPSGAFSAMSIVVKTDGDPARLAPALRAAVASVDRDLPVSEVQTMERIVADATARPRFVLVLLGAFAAVAALLAAVGLYGVTSYAVSRRVREIGVRVALGAARGRVVRLVLGEALGLVALGIALGTLGALAAARLMAGLLFGVGAADPLTFVGVPVLLSIVALAAALGPTRRATAVAPTVALRAE